MSTSILRANQYGNAYSYLARPDNRSGYIFGTTTTAPSNTYLPQPNAVARYSKHGSTLNFVVLRLGPRAIVLSNSAAMTLY